MGFGYLLMGYLITLFFDTVGGVGYSFIGLLIGCASMVLGLSQLKNYEKTFLYSLFVTLPLFAVGVYFACSTLQESLLLNLPFVKEKVTIVFEWIGKISFLTLHLTLTVAITRISVSVGLRKIAERAVRSGIYTLLYGLSLLILMLLPDPGTTFAGCVMIFRNLSFAVMGICELLLLLSCTKNICRSGDEDVTPKKSRFEWVNRIGDAYEKNMQRSVQNSREEAEYYLRKKQGKANRKKNKNKK